MKDQIASLVQMQKINDEAGNIRTELAKGEEKLSALKNDLNEILGLINKQKEDRQTMRQRQRELEADMEDCEALAQKSQERLSAIKNNREYKALLREIDDGKKRVSEMEDQVMECLDQIEEKNKSLIDLEEQHKAVETSMEDEKASVDIHRTEGEKKISRFETTLKKLAKTMPPNLLARFKNTLKTRNGKALAPVDNGVCMGCNMGIPPQMYNELQIGDKLMYCPHCERIIYWVNDK